MEAKDFDCLHRELQQTADGSHTLFVPEMDEHYHSVNGAIQESEYIFIEKGLRSVNKRDIRILEIGFGTGLNALLTANDLENRDDCDHILYYAVEKYPLDEEIFSLLNYCGKIGISGELFRSLHFSSWNEDVPLTRRFTLHKILGDGRDCCFPEGIDLVYFDAFAPDKQPDMWSPEIFDRLYACMASGGVIVTYCAKGEVRRRMQCSGFKMERLPGPPGKRHILRGVKE